MFIKHFLLGALLALSDTADAKKSKLRKLAKNSECTVEVAALLAIDPGSQQDEIFECGVEDVENGKSRKKTLPIQANKEQQKQLKDLLSKGDLVPGQTKLNIAGASVGKEGVFLPPGQDISKSVRQSNGNSNQKNGNSNQKNRKLSTPQFGVKPILVVKVYDTNGLARPETEAEISTDIFGGTHDGVVDQVNLKSQMSDCSFNQLTIVPGENPTSNPDLFSAPGTINVTIPISITDNDRYAIHGAAQAAAEAKLGISLPGPYQQVMFVIEKCYVGCGWAAYAYINSWMSVYQSAYYKHVGVQMHEIGHNFGFAHSGGLNGATYTDHTGLMGNPLYSDEVGKMCWNAAKTYQCGWYADRVALWEESMGTTEFTLVGIANYGNNPDQHPVVIKVETGTGTDQFIAFNRATGVNSQNDEADDEVTVVETGNNGEGYSQSFLKATLLQGESFQYDNWMGTGQILTITTIDIDQDTNPDVWTATVTVSLGPPPPTPAPTSCPVGTEFQLTVLTDNYPGETTWTLVNTCTGLTEASGGPYATSATTYTENACIPSGEYTFTINDSWGDGICCSYGSGSYTVEFGGVVEKEGGAFTTTESTTFGSCGPVTAPTPAPPTLAPTPPPPTLAPTPAPVPPTAAPTSTCSAECCYPAGDANSYMLGICEAQGCSYTNNSNGSPYCYVTGGYTQCMIANCGYTASPTKFPTPLPTAAPTSAPTAAPTSAPTGLPNGVACTDGITCSSGFCASQGAGPTVCTAAPACRL